MVRTSPRAHRDRPGRPRRRLEARESWSIANRTAGRLHRTARRLYLDRVEYPAELGLPVERREYRAVGLAPPAAHAFSDRDACAIVSTFNANPGQVSAGITDGRMPGRGPSRCRRVGLVFYPPRPRCVTAERAAAIVEGLPPFVHVVGVVTPAARRSPTFSDRANRPPSSTAPSAPTIAPGTGAPTFKACAAPRGRTASGAEALRRRQRRCCLDAYQPGVPGARGRRPVSTSGVWIFPAGRIQYRSTTVPAPGGRRPIGPPSATTSRGRAAGAALRGRRQRRGGTEKGRKDVGKDRGFMRESPVPAASTPPFRACRMRKGHFGPYGDVRPETLMAPLDSCARLRALPRGPRLRRRARRDLQHYVGRPSPVYHAERLSRRLAARRFTSSARTSTTPARTR